LIIKQAYASVIQLPAEACVEITCLADANDITPTYVGPLPLQLVAMNASNIYPQLLTIEAAHTGKEELIYQAAMMDPVTGAQLSPDEIVSMCDELLAAHAAAGFPLQESSERQCHILFSCRNFILFKPIKIFSRLFISVIISRIFL